MRTSTFEKEQHLGGVPDGLGQRAVDYIADFCRYLDVVLPRVLELSEQRGNASVEMTTKIEQKISKLQLCVQQEFHDRKQLRFVLGV
jgi:hypothetical protein